MSHSVTIRTQTVTTNSTAIIVNTGYLKTWGGILKLLQLALGIVCVGIVGNDTYVYNFRSSSDLFFLLMATTYMIGTFILLLCCMASFSTASILSKTLYDVVYHGIAFALLLTASLSLLIHDINTYKRERLYELYMGASICGIVNSGLYLTSTIFALRAYRGM